MHMPASKPLPSDRLIAAGLVLEQLGPQAPVTEILVNGELVGDPAAARAAFAGAIPTTPRDRSLFDKWVAKLADKMDVFEARLDRTPVGRKLRDIVMADPEKVTHRLDVEIRLKSGRIIKKDVDVLDRDATHFLQSASAIAELVANIPIPLIGSIIGAAVPAATALAAAIAALVTKAAGKKELSRALARTAGKHAAMASVGWIPFFGFGVLGIATVVDHTDVRENRLAPPASLVEALGTHPKAAPALEHVAAPVAAPA